MRLAAPCAPVLPERPPCSVSLARTANRHAMALQASRPDILGRHVLDTFAELEATSRAASHRGSTLSMPCPDPASGPHQAWVTLGHCTCGGCRFLAVNVATFALE